MIVRNSAKCTACGEEIESKHRHDFVVHFCDKEPTQLMKWEEVWKDGKGKDMKLVPNGNKTTFRFAIDGGKAYIRRAGKGFVNTCIYTEEESI